MNQITPPSLSLPTGPRAQLQPLPAQASAPTPMAADGYARQASLPPGQAEVQAIRQQLMAVHQDLARLQRELQGLMQALPAAAPAPGPGVAEVGAPAPASAGATVVVAPGDFLWKLAEQHLGDAARWPELYELNREAIGENPNLLQPGQRLRLPGVAPQAAAPQPAALAPQGPGPAVAQGPVQGPLPGLPGGPAWSGPAPQVPPGQVAPGPNPALNGMAPPLPPLPAMPPPSGPQDWASQAQQAVANIGLPPLPGAPNGAMPPIPNPGQAPANLPVGPAPYPVVPSPGPQGPVPQQGWPMPGAQQVPTGPAYAPGSFPGQAMPAVRPDVTLAPNQVTPLAPAEALRIGTSYGLIPPGTQQLSPEQQANVSAFAAELKAYEGPLRGQVFGPGMEALATTPEERQQFANSLMQIQSALNTLIASGQLRVTGPDGRPVQQVPVNGSYFQTNPQGQVTPGPNGAPQMDPAFVAAITTFKQQAGIHQNYKLADGSFGINEYVGPATVAALREALARVQR